MKTTKTTTRATRAFGSGSTRKVLAGIVAVVGAIALTLQSSATPPAGAPINNQATATYSDAGNNQRTATSNTVTTYIAQVAGEQLTASQAKNAAPGTQVYYTHTLTNTGNGPDTFTLTSGTTAGFGLTQLALYADANGDGIPDNNTPITSTPAVAAGGVYKFVAVGTVPTGQNTGDTSTITISAFSQFNAAQSGTLTNVDVTTVQSSAAVVNVTKAFSQTSGTAGSGPYTVTFTYTNTGNTTASNLVVSDTLNTAFTYVAGSSRWSVIGSALSDSGLNTAGNGNTITTGSSATNVFKYTVATVAAGESRTISLQVNVAAGTPAGILPNTAGVAYDPTGTAQTPTPQGTTNTANFTVTPTAGVTLGPDPNTVANATQGQTVPFTNIVTNTGNATDTFVITYANNTFPAGSTVQLFKSDGVTPLTTSIVGNTAPDTGPLGAGLTYNVVLKVTLPTGVSGNNGGNGWKLNKIATSTNDPSKSATNTDVLTTITATTVDLTNTVPLVTSGTFIGLGVSTPGYGATGVTPILTATANPGVTTTFPLWVNNTSANSDTYNLSVASVPTGWSVVFKDQNGAVITNTGVVLGGTSAKLVYAYVTSPATQPPGSVPFDFTSASPTSGATDSIRDVVQTATVRNVTITPNNTGQAYPGGSVYYAHTITNNGNVTEGGTTASLVITTSADSLTGWKSIIYQDIHGTGVFAADDPVISGSSISAVTAGSSLKIIVKVTAPPGAAIGQADVATVTATPNVGSYGGAAPAATNATDTTQIISGDLVLVKSQALEPSAGTPDGSLTFTTSPIASAAPGTYLRYKIVATNQGSGSATNVVINDNTPTYTTFSNTGAPVVSGGSAPVVSGSLANGATGSLQFSYGTLLPGQSATATFEVKINP